MKKSILLILLLTVILMLFVGCNSVVNEKQIQGDLEAYTQSEILAENEKIVEIKIDQRQTENEKKQDSVWCTVTTEDEHYSYEKAMLLTYDYYDGSGWKLNDVSVNNRSEWVITPLTGISKEEISDSLDGISVTADNEVWNVKKEKINSISIDEQKTDLESKTDIVTVTFTVDDVVEEASGQLIINYKFNNEWVIDSISGNENFKTSVKPNMMLSVNEETLIEKISEQVFEYGVSNTDAFSSTSKLQSVTIKKNEVSDFVIESQETSSKGTVQTYACKCELTKPHAVFTLNIEMKAYYSGGWRIEPISIEAKCTSVKIDGIWTGTMNDKACELNITEAKADGTISGTFTYYNEAGSYYVSGKIDLNTLIIALEAGDEIKVGINIFGNAYGTSDIDAQLNVDDSTISGTARRGFVVTQ